MEPMADTSDSALSKVPEVTLGFWIIKILATTLGEVGGNAVTMELGFGYLIGSAIVRHGVDCLVVVQVAEKRFRPFLYWAVIVATTLAGTTLADFFDRSLGIGYLGGSLSLFFLVMATIAIWYWQLARYPYRLWFHPKWRFSTGQRLCSRKRSAPPLATGWPMILVWATTAARF
jgi:uncharacterized membrane-anchored protein